MWDADNIGYIAEHGVAPREAEAVVLSHPLDDGYEEIEGEARWRVIGRTPGDRYLLVVFTLRGVLTRVVTAFPAGPAEIRTYLRSLV